MTVNQQLIDAAARRRKQWEATRRQMMSMAGVGVGGRPANYFPDRSSWGPSAAYRVPEPQHPGQMNVRRGAMSNDTEITKYTDMIYGTGPTAPLYTAGETAPAPTAGRGNPLAERIAANQASRQGDKDAYIANVAQQNQRAFDDTQARIEELRVGHSDKRDRALGALDTFGQTQGAFIDERAEEALKTQRALLQQRGLANSSDLPAWMARNARDTSLQKLKLAEDIDDRRVKYDTSLTNEYLGAVERINNRPPDLAQANAIMAKYGASGDGQGYAGADAELGRTATVQQPTYGQQAQGAPPRGVRVGFGNAAAMYGFTGGPVYGQPQQAQQQPSKKKQAPTQSQDDSVAPVAMEQMASNRFDENGLTAMQRRVIRERLAKAQKGKQRSAQGKRPVHSGPISIASALARNVTPSMRERAAHAIAGVGDRILFHPDRWKEQYPDAAALAQLAYSAAGGLSSNFYQ
jgi:hypothetical protein